MSFARALAALAAADSGRNAGVLPAAHAHALDTLACIVGAHADPLYRARAAAIAECGADDASRGFALALEARPAAAAQWLALAAHWLQFDDGDMASGCHPGCCIVPAALAVACASARTWTEFLDAVVRGYAVTIALGKALNASAGPRVFHRTSVAGVFGAAAATACLERLGDADHAASALGLAASFACGVLPSYREPIDAEALHPALAARGGVAAARLVAAGTLGRADALDGPNGLLAAMGATPDPNASGAARPDAILSSYFKPHACVRHAHGPIEIVQGHARGLSWKDIEAVEVDVALPALDFSGTVPQTARGAALSMEYAVAAAARWPDAPLGPGAFSAEARREIIGSGLMGRVSVRHQPRFDGQGPGRRPTRVRLATRTSRYEGRLDDALGDPARPLAERDLALKAKTLVGAALAADDGERFIEAMARAERPRRIASVLESALGNGIPT